jgi:RNA-dependent RNA polymerase
MALDGIKTGMTVSREVLKQDTLKFQKRPPQWKETDEEKARHETNESHVRRPRNLGRFIMDDLYKQADEQSKVWNVRLDEHFRATFTIKRDDDLAAPWEDALARANRWKFEENVDRALLDLDKIRKHVETMYHAHREMANSPRKPSRGSPRKDKLAFTSMPIEVRQDKVREISRRFASLPHPSEVLMAKEELARVRASYAYVNDFNQKNGGFTRFPGDVAMRELCAIKARATGRWKTVAGDFYDHFNMKHPKTQHI